MPTKKKYDRDTQLLTIHKAWTESMDNDFLEELYSLSDGYGEVGYIPEQGYDWSGIRDSSNKAIRAMYEFCISKVYARDITV